MTGFCGPGQRSDLPLSEDLRGAAIHRQRSRQRGGPVGCHDRRVGLGEHSLVGELRPVLGATPLRLSASAGTDSPSTCGTSSTTRRWRCSSWSSGWRSAARPRPETRDRRSVTVPAFGAIGGMVLPIAIFVLINHGTPAAHGWGIVMSSDTAFVIGVLALFGPRCPDQLRLFLLALAVVDDIGAITVMAVFYTDRVKPVPVGDRWRARPVASSGLRWLGRLAADALHHPQPSRCGSPPTPPACIRPWPGCWPG